MIDLYKYNNYLLEQNMRDSSIYLYIYYLKKFLKWHSETIKTPFKKLYKKTVILYLNSLHSKISNKSINNYINFFKSYNNFLIKNGVQTNIVIDNSMRMKNSKHKLHKNSNINENIIDSLLQKICSEDSIKNYTMISLIAHLGLRTIEVTELKLSDINFDKRFINVSGSYGRKVPINSNVENALKLYLKEVYDEQEYLFMNEKCSKYTDAGIRWIFRKNCDDKRITLSSLRNFYRLKLKKQGYCDKEIDTLLGYTTKNKSYIDKSLKEMLTPSQFAKIFNVAPITVIKWCNKGLIKAYKTDKGFRKIPYSEVERLKK